MAIVAARSAAIASVRMISSSGHIQCERVDDVVVVAGRVMDQLAGLGLPDLVRRSRHDRLLALCPWSEREAEGAEGEAPEILPECRGKPALAAIGRHFDDLQSVATVPGNASNRD